jgi:GT2 family glycosyltransferase
VDNDSLIIQPYWLKTIVEIMENHSEIGIIGTHQILPDDASTFLKKIEKTGISIKLHYTSDVCFAQILIRSEVFSTAGLVDEDFFPTYVEDCDFTMRAWKKGWKLVIVPSIRIVHIGGGKHKHKYKSDRNYFDVRNNLIYIIYNLNFLAPPIKFISMYLRMLVTTIMTRKIDPKLKVTPKVISFFIKNLFPIIQKGIYRHRDPAYIKPINFR